MLGVEAYEGGNFKVGEALACITTVDTIVSMVADLKFVNI